MGNREPLWRDGDDVTHCAIVHTGFFASYKISFDREQIVAFHVPGDFMNLQALNLRVSDHDIISLGRSTAGLISRSELRDVLSQSQSLANLFWRETMIESAVLREWICNVAARGALAGLAHLLCELSFRLDAVGLVRNDHTLDLPFTQEDLAAACGLTSVHINRMLKELRRRRLISWEQRTLTILDADELKRVAQFDAGYLSAH